MNKNFLKRIEFFFKFKKNRKKFLNLKKMEKNLKIDFFF